jgi:hypothetical protein
LIEDVEEWIPPEEPESMERLIARSLGDLDELILEFPGITEWLQKSLKIAPWNKAVADRVEHLLGTQFYTCNLPYTGHWTGFKE